MCISILTTAPTTVAKQRQHQQIGQIELRRTNSYNSDSKTTSVVLHETRQVLNRISNYLGCCSSLRGILFIETFNFGHVTIRQKLYDSLLPLHHTILQYLCKPDIVLAGLLQSFRLGEWRNTQDTQH
jgi:hypothetical protein